MSPVPVSKVDHDIVKLALSRRERKGVCFDSKVAEFFGTLSTSNRVRSDQSALTLKMDRSNVRKTYDLIQKKTFEIPKQPIPDKCPNLSMDVPFLEYQDGLILPLEKENYFIGRGNDQDIILNCPEISRSHCTLVKEGNQFRLLDLFSTNGLFVNNERIKGSRELKNGDLIQIGSKQIKFHCPNH